MPRRSGKLPTTARADGEMRDWLNNFARVALVRPIDLSGPARGCAARKYTSACRIYEPDRRDGKTSPARADGRWTGKRICFDEFT